MEEAKYVEISRIIFPCKRKVNWDAVEQYLKRYIGHQYVIEETNDIIYIGSDFPDEYTHSKYSAKIFGTLAKAKANASQVIPELIKSAGNALYQPNLEKKHNVDALNGWYRFIVHFSMPISDDKGNIIGKNKLCGRMVVRCDTNRKMYLYDIKDIKKET